MYSVSGGPGWCWRGSGASVQLRAHNFYLIKGTGQVGQGTCCFILQNFFYFIYVFIFYDFHICVCYPKYFLHPFPHTRFYNPIFFFLYENFYIYYIYILDKSLGWQGLWFCFSGSSLYKHYTPQRLPARQPTQPTPKHSTITTTTTKTATLATPSSSSYFTMLLLFVPFIYLSFLP